jgi:hypothetical protein
MKRKLRLVKRSPSVPGKPGAKGLLADLREMILSARQTVAQGVNSALVLLYWKIGQRIRTDILKEKRAGYGEKILHTLSAKLAAYWTKVLPKKLLERKLHDAVRLARGRLAEAKDKSEGTNE